MPASLFSGHSLFHHENDDDDGGGDGDGDADNDDRQSSLQSSQLTD